MQNISNDKSWEWIESIQNHWAKYLPDPVLVVVSFHNGTIWPTQLFFPHLSGIFVILLSSLGEIMTEQDSSLSVAKYHWPSESKPSACD